MSEEVKTEMEMNAKNQAVEVPEETYWKPDTYYFPTQVSYELDEMYRDVLGKTLTLLETLGLSEKQEKAAKDIFRNTIKERMYRVRDSLQKRLDTVVRLGTVEAPKNEIFSFYSMEVAPKPMVEPL